MTVTLIILKNTVLVQSLPFNWLGYISSAKLRSCFLPPAAHTHSLPLPRVDPPGDSLGSPPPQPLWPPLPSPLSLTPRHMPALLHFRCFNRPSNSKMAHNKCIKVALPCSAAPPLPDPCHNTHAHTCTHSPCFRACTRAMPSPFPLDPPPDLGDFPPSLFLPCFFLDILMTHWAFSLTTCIVTMWNLYLLSAENFQGQFMQPYINAQLTALD